MQFTLSTPPTTSRLRSAASWLAGQPGTWEEAPGYWAGQAQVRYQLSDQETALLLLNMRIQLGHH